jgi:hypothetical protein
MDFRFYILLAIVYFVYNMYNRAKEKAAAQQQRKAESVGESAPTEEENLFDKLRRLAEEARAAQEGQRLPPQQSNQGGQEPQISGRPAPIRSAPMVSQEYPEDWVTTETGKQVRNMEGGAMRRANIREEYNANRIDVRNVEGSMAEQLERYREENKSSEQSLTEEYLSSRMQGAHVKSHGGKGFGKNAGRGMGKGKDGKRLNRFKEMVPMQITRKATHPLKTELFSTQAVRRAFILKEVLEKPKSAE